MFGPASWKQDVPAEKVHNQRCPVEISRPVSLIDILQRRCTRPAMPKMMAVVVYSHILHPSTTPRDFLHVPIEQLDGLILFPFITALAHRPLLSPFQ
jgi:hypothetical protein